VTPFECPGRSAARSDVRCSFVTLPEDDQFPDGPTIEIAVAEIDGSTILGTTPLVFLNGGPGAATLEYIDQFPPGGLPTVLIDQRGTGLSQPNLGCPEIDELDAVFAQMESRDPTFEEIYREATIACRDRLEAEGVNVAAFTTENNADDVALIRRALGYEEWDLWGASYGTRLALTLMRDHPEGIRAVVLDGSFPHPVDFWAEFPVNADRAIRHLIDSCAASESCRETFGDLGALIDEAVAGLDESPATVRVVPSGSGTAQDYLIDGPGLYSLIFEMLYVTDWIPDLPLLISRAAEGDVTEMVERIVSTSAPLALAMYDAVHCPEEVAYFDLDAMLEFLAGLPEPAQVAFDTQTAIDDCAIWGLDPAPVIETFPVTSTIPTLLISGSFDPITPPSWGRLAAETLPNSTFVEMGDEGHGSATECSALIFGSFLIDPTAPLDTSCAEGRTVDFTTS
jgi:pimeloyl-ACP methyl ester carboxylesterase